MPISSPRGYRKRWRAAWRTALFLPLTFLLGSCGAPNTEVILETSAGSIVIELYAKAAPKTVDNFLLYVDAKRYDGAAFYRTVRDDNQAQNSVLIDVIQGGLGFDNLAAGLPPIAHEPTAKTNVKHVDGTISLARAEPGTGSSEFFICLGAQPSLDFGGMRNPDGQGFAAFGRVVQGMEVVRQIHTAETAKAMGELEYTSGQILSEPVVIKTIRRR